MTYCTVLSYITCDCSLHTFAFKSPYNLKMNKICVAIILGQCMILVFCGKITVERKNIVDNGGYVIRNAAISNATDIDLVLQANLPEANEIIGNASLSINEGLRNQKWGAAYYGGTTASLSPGLNGNNIVSVYFPTSGLLSNRLHQRQYTFENCYGNEKFKIRNEEKKLCLCVVERNMQYFADFASCDDPDATIYWTFERYG